MQLGFLKKKGRGIAAGYLFKGNAEGAVLPLRFFKVSSKVGQAVV